MQPRPVVSHSQDESSSEESLPKESIDNPKKRKYTGSTAWNNGNSFFSHEEKAVYVLHELLLKSIEEVKKFIGPDFVSRRISRKIAKRLNASYLSN